MRLKLEEFQKETGNIYNLEATPGESPHIDLQELIKKDLEELL
jgi:anaerobic ribonucleoside-triphosphate reductase